MLTTMMTRNTLLLYCLLLCLTANAQVKPEFLYNTDMPYGTLDIRTSISSTHYYYLEEGITFSFRESSPGVKTNTYLDLTHWDTSPYGEGNMRMKDGATDEFVMNYRFLQPIEYSSTYANGYPLIVLMHGAGEQGNCYYEDCYHADWDYNPNVNTPPAPTSPDHRLLNNDDHLNIGAGPHLDARNRAGNKLPDDPTLPDRSFPGFVLMPQMFNIWDSLSVENMIRLVQLHCEKYNIDENRIYIHGLSIGGYATYEAIKRAPWLFAAALPMSAVREAGNIFYHQLQSKVVHIPIWAFQGGVDEEPTPAVTESLLKQFEDNGGITKYTIYPTAGHNVWNLAYGDQNFFAWMLAKNKSNIHPLFNLTTIDRGQSAYPMLTLAEGFLAYQWEKDGETIADATTNKHKAVEPGVYRARFSRISSSPAESEWNKWSSPVTITEGTLPPGEVPPVITGTNNQEKFTFSVFPNPALGEKVVINFEESFRGPFSIQLVDAYGREHVHMGGTSNQQVMELPLSPGIAEGVYLLRIHNGKSTYSRRITILR